MTPQLPSDADRETPPTAQVRDATTLFTAFALLGVAAGLLFVVGMVLPDAIYLILVVAGFGLYFGLHYLVWGRLMSHWIRDTEETAPPQQNYWDQPARD